MRVPASEVEGLVLDRVRTLLASRKEIADALSSIELEGGRAGGSAEPCCRPQQTMARHAA